MRWLIAFGDLLERLASWLVGLLTIGLLGIVSLQFIDRHFVNVPILAPDAYARILLVWLAFIGFALAARAGLAIRVDLLDHWLSPRARTVLGVAFDILKLAVLVVLVVKGWQVVEIGAYQSILGTDLTTAVPNAGLWLGCLLLFVFFTIEVLTFVTGTGTASDHEAKLEARVE